jgi:hypothetical protein
MSDTTDEMEGLAWQVDEYLCDKGEREASWEAGYHKTSDDREIKLSEMTDAHIRNTIRYFSDHDTTPLEKELNSRKCQS